MLTQAASDRQGLARAAADSRAVCGSSLHSLYSTSSGNCLAIDKPHHSQGCTHLIFAANLSWNSVEQVLGRLPLTLLSLSLSYSRLCFLQSTRAKLAKLTHSHCCSTFDTSKAWPPALTASSTTSSIILAADSITAPPASTQQHLHIYYGQLSVLNTVPGHSLATSPASKSVFPVEDCSDTPAHKHGVELM